MKFLAIPTDASITHKMLNQIRVGNVFTVDDHIKERLVTSAIMYNHQICVSKISPGTIITALVMNAKNSIVLALFQYSLWFIVFSAVTH
jgi:hypothetical protein